MSLGTDANDTIEENIARAEEIVGVEEVATEVDDDKTLFREVAAEYGQLFARECAFIPGSTLKEFDDAVENIMESLDSYGVAIDKMRSDVEFCNGNVLPTIRSRLSALQPLFARIDALESYVDAVRVRTEELETVLRTAETQLPVRGGPVSNAVRNFLRDALPKPALPVSQPAYLNAQPAFGPRAAPSQSGALPTSAPIKTVEPVSLGPSYIPLPKIPQPFLTDDVFQH